MVAGRTARPNIVIAFKQLADDIGAVLARVFGDLAGRGAQSAADNVDTLLLFIIDSLETVERLQLGQ